MKTTPGKLALAMFLVSSPLLSSSQSLKYLDWSDIHARNGVRKVTIEHIEYEQKRAVDTLLVAEVYLDDKGRPTEYVSYFAGGRLFSRECFTYKADTALPHNLVAMGYASRETRWDTVPFNLIRDQEQRVVRRAATYANNQRGVAENYRYGPAGFLVECDNERLVAGKWDQMEQLSFLSRSQDKAHRRENNLTYIYNVDGLLLIRNLYDTHGDLKRVRRYTYHFDETANQP